MRHWWVNQNQTHKAELSGGYMWSPKRAKSDRRNHFYDTMRIVSPGDVAFSFVDTRIHALGRVISYCYEFPKPTEFGSTGEYWANVGWRVDVAWERLTHRVRPKDFKEQLAPHLPQKYSPLRPNGDGLQSVYLAEVPAPMAAVLNARIGPEAVAFLTRGHERASIDDDLSQFLDHKERWEDQIAQGILVDPAVRDTDRDALVRARRGQGEFRRRVAAVERSCRVTLVSNPAHLIASHCKPWRHADHEERLNGENGLLLTPSVDHLFDRGFISFSDRGSLLVSPVADTESLRRMGIPEPGTSVGAFSEGQRKFLEYHRGAIFLESA